MPIPPPGAAASPKANTPHPTPPPGDELSAFAGTYSPRALGLSAGCAPRGTPRTWWSQIGWPRLRWRRLLLAEVRLKMLVCGWPPCLAMPGAWTQGPPRPRGHRAHSLGLPVDSAPAPVASPVLTCAAPSTCPGRSALSTSELPQAVCGHSVALLPRWVALAQLQTLLVQWAGQEDPVTLWHLPGPCLSQLLPCCSAASPWAQAAFSVGSGSTFAAYCKSSGPSFTLPPTSGLTELSGRGLGSGDPGGEPDGQGHLVGRVTPTGSGGN